MRIILQFSINMVLAKKMWYDKKELLYERIMTTEKNKQKERTGSIGLNGEKTFDISAIILTYHPVWEKLRKTIISLLLQQDVSMQIIVADDGSENNFRNNIIDLFDKYHFSDYKLVMNPENQGTVKNFISALRLSDGQYVKALSPGDYLTGETVFHDILEFMKEKNCVWSFSEMICYHSEKDAEVFSTNLTLPVYLNPYLNGNEKRMRWNYVVWDDTPVGCVLFGKTQPILKYAEEIYAAGIKYAEDYLYRLMMFDGICGCYYPAVTTFYELGTGISTGKSDKWIKILYNELLIANHIMAERENKDRFQRKMVRYINRKSACFLFIAAPGKVIRKFLLEHKPRSFPVDIEATAEWRKECR